MGDITIHLCKGISGEVVSADLPDDVPIPEIMAILDRRFEIGIGEMRDRYVLYNISQKFEYTRNDTLASRATAHGDLSILVDALRCEFDCGKKP